MRRLLVVAGLLFIAACQKKLEGPVPSVNGVAPPAVCQQQLDTTVELSGQGLSPLYTSALEDGQLELPRVSLLPVAQLDGMSVEGVAVEIPDDPRDPASSKVRWKSQESMSFRVDPALNLAPGLYDIGVVNASGGSTTFSGGLLAVPPPTLLRVSPDIVCGDHPNTVSLNGDFFIEGLGGKPKVKIGELTFDPTALEDCRQLPGPSGLRACKTLRFELPTGSLANALHEVQVVNPGPVGCGSTELATLTVVPAPTLASVQPDLVCTAQGANALTATGSDFLTIGGVAPTLVLEGGGRSVELATTANGCAPLTGPSDVVERCTSLAATLPESALPPGTYQARIKNPAPADCESQQPVGFVVVPAPTVTSVVPQVVCNAEGPVVIEVNGSGFLVVDGQSPTVRVGTTDLAATPTTCTPISGTSLTASSCARLSVTVPTSVAFGAQPVTVINPSPAGCASASGPVLTLFDRPTIASIVPAGVCAQSGGTSVVITGQNFVAVTIGGTRAVPLVQVGPQLHIPTTSGCTTVPNTTEPVEACTTLTITVAGTSFTPNVYDLVVTNPVPVGCSSNATGNFRVTPAPTITSVTPTSICAGGDTLVLSGSDFVSGASVTMTGPGTVQAMSVVVSNDGGTALATFGSGLTTGSYNLTLDNGGSCSASAPSPINVIPGPQLFFVDPAVVYNGITVQATVYGTGFTLPVNDISLEPIDGGAPVSLQISSANQNNRAQVLVRNVDGGVVAPGSYAMTLDDGTTCNARLVDAVTVVNQTTLVLTSMDPPFGTVNTTTGVTIKADVAASGGTGFLPVPRVYLNPSIPTPTTVAAPVGAVAYVDGATLTALVPDTLSVGDYDLIVVNPDGRVGVATNAFRVTQASQPPPSISSLSPGSLPNTGSSNLEILGANFRDPLTVSLRSCVDGSGAAVALPTITVSGTPTATNITATVSNVGGAAACVVRVTNTDNGTYADFSALVFTNPSKNLYPAQNGPSLTVPRRAPVALGGDATGAARFLYIIGGDNGATTGAYDSVEVSTLNLLGVPGAFFTPRQGRLNTVRSFSGGARIGRWLYVAGGTDGTNRLSSLERSYILDPARRGEVIDLLLDPDNEGNGLPAGLYYYRVAAVMGLTDPFNPDGEELASDPFPVRLPSLGTTKFRVTVTWKPVSGAVKYLVYRSPVADVPVGTEQVIAEVTSGVQYIDSGVAPILTQNPLPIGSLGKWQPLTAALSMAREGPGVTWARDPTVANVAYLYVLGGKQANNAATNTYEYLPITLNADGSQTPAAAFVSGGTNTLSSQRWQLAAAAATNDLSPRIPAGRTFIYALSGVTAAGAVSQAPSAAEVQAGGALTTFVSLPNLGRAGYAAMVAADQVFAFGGNNASADSTINNGEICGSGNTVGQCATDPNPPRISNWNTGQNMNVARYLLAGTLHGAYIYVVGGSGSGGTPLSSTEYRIW
ncbi:MAG: hypothetical protein ACOZIN_14070 [Myxococcota bacterium]